ncbi:MAG TPA: efflux RND transporter periplasmic adaptor subunit [bacterium]|nr:efflux RND transporter periplasmic adaptor subunit [bacterium]
MQKCFIGLSLSVMMIVMVACGSPEKSQPNQTATPVRTITIRQKPVNEKTALAGTLQGDKRITLSTKIMGQVLAIHAHIGDRVAKGQLLIKIKSDDLSAKRAQIAANKIEAEAALKNMESNYHRIKELYARKSATQKEMDDTEMAYAMTQAKLKAVEEMEKEINDVFGYSDITAPIDGYVVQKLTEVGNTAAPGMPLMVIEDLSSFKVIIPIPESDAASIRIQDAVEAEFSSDPKHRLNGYVSALSPSAVPGSRQYDAEVKLHGITENLKKTLRSGMFVRIYAGAGQKNMITVPDSVIHRRGQLEGVFVVSAANQALLRWIRPGKSYGNEVEVLSGLDFGDRVIYESTERLSDGDRVEVRP